MKGYVYNLDTYELVAVINGDDNDSIESAFEDLGYDTDLYGLTYSVLGLDLWGNIWLR